jgi:5-methylcytosine-specific restriction enzyme subunit McrC
MNILYENDYIPKNLADYKEINNSIANNKKLHRYFELNFDGIKTKNYCGFVCINNKNFFIAPKIAKNKGKNADTNISINDTKNLDIFIYMLVYAYGIKLSNENITTLQNEKSKIFEIFIRHFADSLFNELKKGVYKTYTTKQKNLKILKGKYLIEKNFSNFKHQNIYCEIDEFSANNELNKFFVFAIKIFAKHSKYTKLKQIQAIFDEVDYKHININKLKNINNIHFNRMNARFKNSYNIALIILNKLISMPNTNDKNSDSFAFLFDMSEVFEKFIGNIYKSISENGEANGGNENTTILQEQKHYGSLVLKPDIIFKDSNNNKIIIDTKYKNIKTKNDLKTQDKYQMFVYGTNFKIKENMLLYPKHLSDIVGVDDNLKLGKNELIINLKLRSIDLDSIKKSDEYFKVIKNRVTKILE